MSWPDELAVDQRIEEADEKIQAAIDRLLVALALHENNKIVFYSNMLSDQIPRSFAAHSFELFRKHLHNSELLAVCTLWDPVRKDRNSLPTIVALVDHPEVEQALADRSMQNRIRGHSISAQNDDPDLHASQEEMSNRRADEDSKNRAKELQHGIQFVREFAAGDVVKAVRDFRDVYLAHALEPKAKRNPELPAKYGHEREMIEASKRALDALNLGVRNASYGWDDFERMWVRNAGAFWEGVKMEVKE